MQTRLVLTKCIACGSAIPWIFQPCRIGAYHGSIDEKAHILHSWKIKVYVPFPRVWSATPLQSQKPPSNHVEATSRMAAFERKCLQNKQQIPRIKSITL